MGLFNSIVLDCIVGLVFVYLLLAILCTAANECIAALTRRRGVLLERGIRQVLRKQPLADDDRENAFAEMFYAHPLIKSLRHDRNHPAYISSRTFIKVVTDVTKREAAKASSLATTEAASPTRAAETTDAAAPTDAAATADAAKGADAGERFAHTAGRLPDGDVKQSLMTLMQYAKDSDEEKEALENWFNDAMDRVTGWYKRRTQIWILGLALALTIVANADTVQITRRLWVDPVLRSAVVEEAKARAQKPPAAISVEYEEDADATVGTVTRTDNQANQISPQERELLGQLIGWRGVVQNNTWRDWGERSLGWLLTVLALSLGAPFWFDLLNKFMNVRYAGKSPTESQKTK